MSRRELLQRIALSTEKFFSEFGDKLPKRQTPIASTSTSIPAPPLDLTRLTSRFHAEIKRHKLVPQIKQLAITKASDLEALYQRTYATACLRLKATAKSDRDPYLLEVLRHFRSTLENFYSQQDLPRLLEDISNANVKFCRLRDSSIGISQPKDRPAFNHQCTPLLESYFESNPYPSLADRQLLARKTQMTPRQIEVWFQNHRNRSKQPDLLRKCKGTRLLQDPTTALLESLIGSSNIVKDQSLEVTNEDDRAPAPRSNTLEHDPFNSAAPPHAFPTVFSDSNLHNPFPSEGGIFKFTPPIWARRPAAIPIQRGATTTVDELVNMFSTSLVIREGSSRRHPARKAVTPWFLHRITVPPSAPLPAFIRNASTSHPSHAVSPQLSQTGVPKHRKQAALSMRRIPTVFSPCHPFSSCASSADPWGSRTASSSSTASSASDSSSASDASAQQPATPHQSPASPPSNIMFMQDEFAAFGELFSSGHDHLLLDPDLQSSFGFPDPVKPDSCGINPLLTMPVPIFAYS
ncbi:hypothetical protein NLJ89_g1337 [Agrocybe chaxingu]|uniref:Homeobox domain-containing protein n=1 Tax=Agrocybe chaxingu TaxID=84603 RepID=A0A9W8N0B2_9AGAR|nr:hypothetical protein NLJ89_g1337 [Agrocybe chaxingu]